MSSEREMQRALELDGEKLRQLTGEDHGPWFIDDYPGQAPCPACFESSGYLWEHGNDWNSGPWSHQTNIPCRYCNGTGTVDSPLVTLDDLENQAADEADAKPYCTLGVGCDEAGVCYAVAHGQPDQCPCRHTGDCDGSYTHPEPGKAP